MVLNAKSPTDNGNNFLHNAYRDTRFAVKGLGAIEEAHI